MAFNQLNVTIGARFENFNRELARVERDLQRFSRKMGEIGANLTQLVSVPLAGLGAAAVQSFAGLEKLQKTLESVMGSGGAAGAELEKLREVAKAPGLSFEQAVQGSARLQAVGLSADQARETIKQFANAVARSGGGAAEFDGVTRALGQIASKGKVSAEEINQINERIFEIRPALQAAFGTSNSEELQALGISSEEFIAKVTQEFAKLERVNGGLANSFENFRDSVKNSLARLGQEIAGALNITGILDKASAALENVATQFSLLSTEAKQNIVIFAGIAAAIGPALLVLSKLSSGFSLLVLGAKSLVSGGVALVGFFGGLPGVIGRAFAALSTFSAAIGGLVPTLALVGAAIGAVVLVYQSLQRRYELATAANRALKEVQSEAIKQTAQEIGQVKRLAETASSEVQSKQNRINALNRLKEIAPEYFKNLDLESAKTGALIAASDAYAQSLINRAKAQIAAQKIAEIDAKLLDKAALAEESRVTLLQTIGNAFVTYGNSAAFAGKQVSSTVRNIDDNVAALKRQRDALEKFLQTSVAQTTQVQANPFQQDFARNPKETAEEKKLRELIKKRGSLVGKLQEFKDKSNRISEIQGPFTDQTITLTDKYRQSIEALADQYSALKNATVSVREGLREVTVGSFINESVTALRQQIEGLGLSFDQISERAVPSMIAAVNTGAQVFSNFASQGINSVKDLGRAVLAATAQIVKSFIQQGVAAAVANALKNPAGIIPPVGLALAAAAGAAAGGLFQGLINRLKIPALASGGLATGPTLALVGEYPGAKSNPEVIAPLNKLRDIVSGQGAAYIPDVRIEADAIRIMFLRAERGHGRKTSG